MAKRKQFVIKDGTLLEYRGPGGDVVIPEGVHTIGYAAFEQCESLTSVVIPQGVTDIRYHAFSACKNLISVTLPDSLTCIGRRAFEDCKKLREFTVPHGNVSIEATAFYNCYALADQEGFVVFNGLLVCYIGFSQNLVIPDCVTAIGSNVFPQCNQIHSVIIPDSVTYISPGTFRMCEALRTLTLPDSITEIGEGVFSRCTNLHSVTLPAGLTAIPERAFEMCSHLTDLLIPASVRSIGNDAFEHCQNLQTLTFAEGFRGDGIDILPLLQDCKRLEVLIAPWLSPDELNSRYKPAAAVGYLSCPHRYQQTVAKAFQTYIKRQKCRVLAVLFSRDLVQELAQLTEFVKITAANFDSDFLTPALEADAAQCVAFLMNWKNRNLSPEQRDWAFQRELMKDPYRVADMKKLWSYQKQPDGSLVIRGYKGKEVTVAVPPRIGKAAVTAIGDSALDADKPGKPKERRQQLQMLQSLILPDTVTHIGDRAFAGCKSLRNIYIPEGVISIGASAFYDCKQITSITLPRSLAVIHHRAFPYPVTHHVPADSYAEAYARENTFPFSIL